MVFNRRTASLCSTWSFGKPTGLRAVCFYTCWLSLSLRIFSKILLSLGLWCSDWSIVCICLIRPLNEYAGLFNFFEFSVLAYHQRVLQTHSMACSSSTWLTTSPCPRWFLTALSAFGWRVPMVHSPHMIFVIFENVFWPIIVTRRGAPLQITREEFPRKTFRFIDGVFSATTFKISSNSFQKLTSSLSMGYSIGPFLLWLKLLPKTSYRLMPRTFHCFHTLLMVKLLFWKHFWRKERLLCLVYIWLILEEMFRNICRCMPVWYQIFISNLCSSR